MAPATRHDETNTLVVPTSESDIVSAQGTGRKYAGVIALFALVAVIVGGLGMHRRSVQSNTQDAEIGDIIEACADYTVQASCSAASCNWNSATVQCEEAAHRQKKPYVVASEREAQASPTTDVTIKPSTITAGVATPVTLFGFYLTGATYDWSAAGAADCTGVTAGTKFTSPNQVIQVNMPAGVYQLCYNDANAAAGGTSAQTNGVLTVQAATPANVVTIKPSTIPAGVATPVTFAGFSVNGDKYDWSAAGAADCTGTTPGTVLTSVKQIVPVNLPVGKYQLCYRSKGRTDSVPQTNGVLTVQATPTPAATPAPPTNGPAATAAPTPVPVRMTTCNGAVNPSCVAATAETGTLDLGEQFSCATVGKPEVAMMSICTQFKTICTQPQDAAWLKLRPRCNGVVPKHP